MWRLPTDAKMWWRYVAKEPIPKKCHNYFCDDIINPDTEKLYQSIGFNVNLAFVIKSLKEKRYELFLNVIWPFWVNFQFCNWNHLLCSTWWKRVSWKSCCCHNDCFIFLLMSHVIQSSLLLQIVISPLWGLLQAPHLLFEPAKSLVWINETVHAKSVPPCN